MPTYCFISSRGERKEMHFPMSEVPDEIRTDDRVWRRDRRAEILSQHCTLGPERNRQPGRCGTWPKESYALGVHPSQIPEQMAYDRKHGINSRYNQDNGNAILSDRGQRRDMLKLNNLVDFSGGYGDA